MAADRTWSIALAVIGATAAAALAAVLYSYWDDEDWTHALLGAAEFFVFMLIVYLALAMLRRRRSSRE